MRDHKLITISKTGTISYYTPPQTTPHRTLTTNAPTTISNTLPLLTHEKSSIHHAPTKTRIPTPPITALTSHPPLLATGNNEGFITITNHQNTFTTPTHINRITALTFCDAGETLISAGIDGFVHVTRLSNLSKPFITLPHPLPVTTFALGYCSTTARIVTASARCTRVWHISSARLLVTVRHSERVTALAMGPGEDFWWGGGSGGIGFVSIGELPVGGVVQGREFTKRDSPVGCLVVGPEGLVVGFDDGVVQVYDPVSKVLIRSFGGGVGVIGLFVQYGNREDFESGVMVGGATGEGLWEILKDCANDVFEEEQNTEAFAAKEIQRLAEEVAVLRKRNRELEDAGLKLIELVEKDR